MDLGWLYSSIPIVFLSVTGEVTSASILVWDTQLDHFSVSGVGPGKFFRAYQSLGDDDDI